MARHPWEIALAVLGVTLGVAVVVSMDLANQSAKRAFVLSTDSVVGKATHTIVGGPGGLPEEVYRSIRLGAGIRTIAPLVEGYGLLSADGRHNEAEIPVKPFRLVGIDPISEASFRPYLSTRSPSDLGALITQPGAVLISADSAEFLGVDLGDHLELNVGGIRNVVNLVGILEPAYGTSGEALSDLLVSDIATGQELFGAQGRLSRIDLILTDGEDSSFVLEKIRAVLPLGLDIESSSARSESVTQLTRAFEVNLTVLSLLALLVGTFLIYNTITFSVVRRRPIIGALRAVGVTRGGVVALILGEAALIGVVSSVFGVLMGILLGFGILDVVTQTINDLYYVVAVRQLEIPLSVLIKGGLLGMVATLGAAILPALEAASVSPRSAMTRSNIESRFHHGIPQSALGGIVLLAVGGALLLASTQHLLASFMGMFVFFLGFAMLIPEITLLVLMTLTWLPRRLLGLTGSVAIRGTSTTLSRTAIAITALTVALSITIGIGTMVQSFRGTVEGWLEASLVADIYLTPTSVRSGNGGAAIEPEVLDRLVNAEGIIRATNFRSAKVESSDGEVQLVALGTDFDAFNRPKRFREGSPAKIWREFQDGNTVIVSEPLAFHRNLEIGSKIELQTNRGMRDFRVAGIYIDYSSGQGVVMVSRSAYQRFWDDDGVSSLGLYVAPDEDVNSVISQLHQLAGEDQELQILSNRALRTDALEIFDRSFTITSVIRMLAMIVAFVGVLSALMALQLERSREIGTLRTIGFTSWQIWRMITAQTGLMGLISGLLSVPMGLALAAALVFVVNRRSFGWSMDLQIFPLVLTEAIALAVVASLLAGLYPAIKMARYSPAEALREE
jgi:putative ABC transport system permease protein